MATRKKYTDPDGKTYYVLPRIWHGTAPITETTIGHLGWTVEDEAVADPVVPTVYSKLFLRRKLTALGLWATVEEALTSAGVMWQWEDTNNLSTDDEVFSQMLSTIAALLPEGTDTDAILAECVAK